MVLHVGTRVRSGSSMSTSSGTRAAWTGHDVHAGAEGGAVLLGHSREGLRRRGRRFTPGPCDLIRSHLVFVVHVDPQCPDSHLRAVGPFEALWGPEVALLWSWAVVWMLRDPLGAPSRTIHGAHGGGASGRSRSRAHTSRGTTGASVGHELVVISWTSHLTHKHTHILISGAWPSPQAPPTGRNVTFHDPEDACGLQQRAQSACR